MEKRDKLVLEREEKKNSGEIPHTPGIKYILLSFTNRLRKPMLLIFRELMQISILKEKFVTLRIENY